MFLAFADRASFVETAITTGLLFLRCDLHAMQTGVSVMAFANFAIVLPVAGATTTTSSIFFGPIGSAPVGDEVHQGGRLHDTYSRQVRSRKGIRWRAEFYELSLFGSVTVGCGAEVSAKAYRGIVASRYKYNFSNKKSPTLRRALFFRCYRLILRHYPSFRSML